MFKRLKNKLKNYWNNKNKLHYHLTFIISLAVAALINWELLVLILIFDICMSFKIVNIFEMCLNKKAEEIKNLEEKELKENEPTEQSEN